jgi:D-threo-aldose 1-dehydrogenase
MLKTSVKTPKIENFIFGGATIGCLFKEVEEEQAKEALQEALQLGVTYFDTAPFYGAGLSEKRMGKYVPKQMQGEKIKISTKCGRIIKNKNETTEQDRVEKTYGNEYKTENIHPDIPIAIYTKEGILESLRQSRERLNRHFIDCLRLHDAEDEERFAEATAPGAAIDTMVELRSKGEIGEVSLGLNNSKYLLRFVKKYPTGTFDNIMMAGCWNLIDQDGYELLFECQKKNIKVTNVGIFASGLLAGSSNYKYNTKIPVDVRYKLEKWQSLSKKYGVEMLTLALHFAFLPNVVDYVSIGVRDAEKAKANVELFNKSSSGVTVELWKEAQKLGLIRKEIEF